MLRQRGMGSLDSGGGKLGGKLGLCTGQQVATGVVLVYKCTRRGKSGVHMQNAHTGVGVGDTAGGRVMPL